MKPTASPAVTRSRSTPPSSHSRTGLPACPSDRARIGHLGSPCSPLPPHADERVNPALSLPLLLRAFLRTSAPPRQKHCLSGPSCVESGTATPPLRLLAFPSCAFAAA